MANPQWENGYTKIANDILEALAGIRINGEARQCLDVVLRKTYGFNKKEDIISLSQFTLITHLGKEHLCRNLNKLAKMNLIITQKGNGKGNIYRFNKDYSTWKPLPKKVTITQKGNKPLPKKVNTKETLTKERKEKEYKEKEKEMTDYEKTIFEQILEFMGKADDKLWIWDNYDVGDIDEAMDKASKQTKKAYSGIGVNYVKKILESYEKTKPSPKLN